MSSRANLVKSELSKIYNLLNESYEFVNIARLENDNRFIKVIELIVVLSHKSDNLRQVIRGSLV